jgi:hypothetical protein
MWKEEVVAEFKVLSRHSHRGTKENHEKSVRIASLLAEI